MSALGPYDPENDGSLEDYLSGFYGTMSRFALFKGREVYDQLWEGGFFDEEFSIIRIATGAGHDEHYQVIGSDELKGIGRPGPSFGGQPGTHTVDDIIGEETLWEAQHLDLDRFMPEELRRHIEEKESR